MKNKITILILLIITLSSCTVGKLSITKRHYRSGFSIDYATAPKNNKFEATSQKGKIEAVADQLAMTLPDSANQQALMSTTYADMVNNAQIINSSKKIDISSNEQPTGNKTIYHQPNASNDFNNNITPNDTNFTNSKINDSIPKKKVLEGFSLMGFLISPIGWIWITNIGDHLVPSLAIFVLLNLALILGLIFIFIGLARFKKYKEKYCGKALAYLGIIIITPILLILLMLSVFFILLSL